MTPIAESTHVGQLRTEVPEARAPTLAARVIQRLLRPHWLIVIPLALSFLAWIIPWSSGVPRGFDIREALTWPAVVTLTAWYALAALGALAFFIGRRLAPIRLYDSFPDRTYYRYFTVLASFGVFYTYARITVDDPHRLVHALRTRTFNEVRYALEYGAGFHTIRYAAILAGGVALYRVFLKGELRALHVYNLVLLLAGAAIASRLSLLMAIIVALGLFAYREAHARFPTRRVLVLAGILVVGLVVFNDIRNAGFYTKNFGVSNPVTAAAYQAITYVGAPFQGSVAVARHRHETLARSLIVNGGGESGGAYWESFAAPGATRPTLSATANPAFVAEGERALLVQTRNSLNVPRSAFLFTDSANLVDAKPGEHYLLRATVSGSATPKNPIRLGVRVDYGSITQSGLGPPGAAISAREPSVQRRLSGIFTVPRGVSVLQLAVWHDRVASHSTYSFVVDDAAVIRVTAGGRALSIPPKPLLSELGRYALPTYVYRRVGGEFATRNQSLTARESLALDYGRIDDRAMTPSAVGPMLLAVGKWAFPLILVVAALAALAVGHATRYRSYFLAAAFVIAYCFADLWRAYLFNFGIIHFLLFTLLLVPPFHAALTRVVARVRT